MEANTGIEMSIPDNYSRRLTNYLRWATMDSVGMAGSTRALCAQPEIPDGLPAEEVMYRWETKGEKNLPCRDHQRLYRYAAGKSVRDFYVSNWTKDVREGMFVAEEFLGVGGMDIEEFHKVFGRYPDLWLLKRIWKLDVSTKAETATPVNTSASFWRRAGAWLGLIVNKS